MERDKARAMLARMAETLTQGAFTAVPKKLFVFGSFARGALAPNDLDVLLLYDFPADHGERLEAHGKNCCTIADMYRNHPDRQYTAEIKKRLRKPGQKIELLVYHTKHPFVTSLFAGRQGIKPDDLRLVWRKGDKTAWHKRIDALKADPEAGRMPRDHIFPVKRLAEGLPYMEMVVTMIERHLLRYRFLPLESVPVKLTKIQRQRNDMLTSTEYGRPRIGREAGRLLACQCGWANMHGDGDLIPGRDLVAVTPSLTLRAHLGRPSLRSMVQAFEDRPQLKRQALIPYIKRGEVNGILEFERGDCWDPKLSAEMIQAADRSATPC